MCTDNTLPVVSVIVPVFNQGQYLSETLDSVLNQTFSNWECVIINDGSTDDSELIAKHYAQVDRRFHYIYQENSGVVLARNRAIQNSLGKYILPLDADDIISPEYLSLAVDVLESNENVALVYCDVYFIGERSGHFDLPELSIDNILHTGCCVNSSMFRRASFDEIGGYKMEMLEGCEDWEFFISLLELGGEVFKINRVLFYYRITNSSRNSNIDHDKSQRLRRLIFSLHQGLYYDDYVSLYEENRALRNAYNSIMNSRSFRMYNFLMKPFRHLFTLLHI